MINPGTWADDEAILCQRAMVRCLNLTAPENRGALTTDIIMRDPHTGEALSRAEVFNRHAVALLVYDEIASRGAA